VSATVDYVDDRCTEPQLSQGVAHSDRLAVPTAMTQWETTSLRPATTVEDDLAPPVQGR